MPIVSRHPTPEPSKRSEPVNLHTENETAVVDSDVQRLDHLLTHVEGMSWYVTFYQQILGEHDQTATQETSLDPTLQQYRKVEAFEFKVQSPLDVSTNNETYAQTLTGSAVIYPGTLIPNRGDSFLADIGAGELGVFTLTDVELRSHYNDRCYEISYRMVRRVSSRTDPYLTDLDNKVVQEYTYQKDYLVYGKDPVITASEATLNSKLQSQIDALLVYYFNVYYSDDHATLLFPDTKAIVYDPAIPKVLLSLFNTHEHPLIKKLRTINTEAIPETQQMTIWDVLLRRTPELLPTIPKKATLVPVGRYANNPQLYNIAYSGLEYVVVPEKVYSVNQDPDIRYLHDYIPTLEVRYKDLGKMNTGQTGTVDQTPDTPIARRLGTYLLTAAAYEGSQVDTRLESLVSSYLNKTGADREQLVELSTRALRWPYLEGYYYIPVLLILMLTSLRGA